RWLRGLASAALLGPMSAAPRGLKVMGAVRSRVSGIARPRVSNYCGPEVGGSAQPAVRGDAWRGLRTGGLRGGGKVRAAAKLNGGQLRGGPTLGALIGDCTASG